MADILNDFARAIGPDPGQETAHLAAEAQDEDTLNLTQRSRMTAQALADIGRSVSGYSGRKNLFWLSASFPFGMNAQLQIDRSFQALDVLDTTNLIEDLQIALYPIDLGGITTDLVSASSNGGGEVPLAGGATIGDGGVMSDQFNARSGMRSAMNDLAHASGGEAFYGTNDIAGAIDHAVVSGSVYYTLAYRPTNPRDDSRYREISVKVDRPDCKLSHRRGYYATPPLPNTGDPISTLTSALQPGTIDSSLLRLRASLLPTPSQPAPAVAVTVDASDLTYRTDAAGHRHTQLLIAFLGMPRAGDEQKTTAPPQAQTVLNLDPDPKQYAALLRSGLQFREQLPAAFANHDLRLGIEEVNTGRVGTLTMTRPAR
jgi:hypothetical protein